MKITHSRWPSVGFLAIANHAIGVDFRVCCNSGPNQNPDEASKEALTKLIAACYLTIEAAGEEYKRLAAMESEATQ